MSKEERDQIYIAIAISFLPKKHQHFKFYDHFSNQQDKTPINAVHGYLLQILYLLRSTKQQNYDIDVSILQEFLQQFLKLKLAANNIMAKTYLEILMEILLM